MENNFDKSFKELTGGQFGYIRFKRAEYNRADNRVKLYFLRSTAVDDAVFNDGAKASVNAAIAQLLPDGVIFDVTYVKTFADEPTVKTRVRQYFAKEKPIVANQLEEEDIRIVVTPKNIKITLLVRKETAVILEQGNVLTELADTLMEQFVEDVTVELYDKKVSDDDGDYLDGVEDINYFEGARMVKIRQGNVIFGKGVLQRSPTYICDAVERDGLSVLCGKITNFEVKEYANKNYGKTDAKKGQNTTDETLKMYKFVLNDTTGNLSCVVFPRGDSSKVFMIDDGLNVACDGTVARNSYSGDLQLTVKNMWHAAIDYDSIRADRPTKPTPARYSYVFPQKFVELRQMELDERSNQIAPYLLDKTFVAFDTETTGLDAAVDKIIELSAVKIVNGRIVESFDTLIDPEMHIPERSLEIHGIHDDEVQGKPVFRSVLPDFYKFTRGAILVGHNIDFDYKMLLSNSKGEGYLFDNELIDTCGLARKYLASKIRTFKLGTVCDCLNVSLVNAHRALGDATATAECFIKLAQFIDKN